MIQTLLILAMLPLWALGGVVVYHIAREQKPPADSSNRIGKLRLVWFALTKEEDFVGMYPWLANDEGDNV